MIGISKPARVPAILRNRGQTTTRANETAYDLSPAEYRDGSIKFEFKPKLYGAKSVKNALTKAQHGKCCFCESKVQHVAYGDVEHFRPKKGYRQVDTDALGRPGYYWLAYDWENLLFSCQLCNQRYKKNLFPLRDRNLRAISHHDDIGDEEPLFINPALVDPAPHISFREEIPYAVEGSALGAASIAQLGLGRTELNERRMDRLGLLLALSDVLELLPEEPLGLAARAKLHEAVQDSAEYASMARAALNGGA